MKIKHKAILAFNRFFPNPFKNWLSSIMVVIYWLTMLTTVGCNDVFEKDIEDDVVILIAPGDALVTDSTDVTFFWEDMDGAGEYVFQLVTGDFNAPDLLLMDSLVLSNKLTLELDSGSYAWGVSAQNNGYATGFSVRTLTITSGINNDALYENIFPRNNMILSDTAVAFVWDKQENAERYIFELLDTNPPVSEVRPDNFYTVAFERINAAYQWQVTTIFIDGENRKSPVFNFSLEVE